ncbi:acyl carrier protein [Roseibium album]|uniref:acyl carrier protein n=1 Tax=Roseibium album TaxID=311410 RepID=UPI0024910F32|nr:acyl carrier protein [Roseibium album]
MQKSDLLNDLTEIFEDVMDVEDLELHDGLTADDVEEWDSLSHVRLIVAIEQKYGIKFTNSEIESLRKLKDVTDLIQAKMES